MAGKETDSVAVDVLLEPDERMLARAEADNARLRAVFPGGFALDAAHRPHVTLLQCFVAATGLEAFCAAVGDVLRTAGVSGMALQAVRLYYEPAPGAGLAGISVAPTPELLGLQASVIAAAAPSMLATGTIDAFTGGHDNPAYDALLVDYVSRFTAEHAGAGFNPHVTTGVAPIDFLDRMLAEPFAPFAFAPASAAVYQLGPFGTAARLLERWA